METNFYVAKNLVKTHWSVEVETTTTTEKAQPSKLESSAFFSYFRKVFLSAKTFNGEWHHNMPLEFIEIIEDCFSDKISKKNCLENLAK